MTSPYGPPGGNDPQQQWGQQPYGGGPTPGTPSGGMPAQGGYPQQPGQPQAPYGGYGQQPQQPQPTQQYGQPQYGQQSPAQPPYGQQPYGATPGYGHPGQAPANHPSATTALVLSLIGLVGIALCGGITLVLSPFAWRMGARAVREIDANPGMYAGRDQANAGRIMGLIGTVLLGLAVLAFVAAIALLMVASVSTTP
jgi:hypothetical protein